MEGIGSDLPPSSTAVLPQLPLPTLTLCCWLRVAFSCCASFLFSSSTWQGTGWSPEGSRQGRKTLLPPSPGHPLAHPWPTQPSPAPTVHSGIKQREEAQPQMVLPCQSSARCPRGRHLPRDEGASCETSRLGTGMGALSPQGGAGDGGDPVRTSPTLATSARAAAVPQRLALRSSAALQNQIKSNNKTPAIQRLQLNA